MMELGISQAQAQFTKLLNQTVTIVDKKSNHKKAVILPYDDYISLLTRVDNKVSQHTGKFDKFVGILDDNFKTSDIKYNEIVK